MNSGKRIVLWLGFFSAIGFAADTISFSESRPLSRLSVELQNRYGYPVTYEEAPHDTSTLNVDVRANGSRYSSPPFVPIVFHVPDVVIGTLGNAAAAPGAAKRIPYGLPDVILPLVKEYNESGNPGKFTALFEGGYAHIVPTIRTVNGQSANFQPILETIVAINALDQPCNQTLSTLLSQVAAARGVPIVTGIVPVGPLLQHKCSVVSSTLPARDVLAQILDQIGVYRGSGLPKPRYSWGLLYDSNTNKYFFSTSLVPDLMPHPSPKPIPPVPNNAPPVVAVPGASRVGVPAAAPTK